MLDPKLYTNPGYPFFIPGIAGQRAPHPPLDFAHENPDYPRSATLDGNRARLVAGVGVVGDSYPEAELAETQLKLQALLAAVVRP